MDDGRLIAIVGPTGVGKSEIAMEVARQVGGAIISCDSMQVYQEMDIGTAKPTLEERREVRHYLIDVVPPWYDFTVAEYKSLAEAAIRECWENGVAPLLVGGTGLYYQAVVDNYQFPEKGEPGAIRRHLEERAAREGVNTLYNLLEEIDPASASRISPGDARRIIRALEVYMTTGERISEQAEKKPSPYDLAAFGIIMERTALYERIDRRVDIMLEKGLIEEVRNLSEQGVTADCTSMQAIGYKEIVWYLKGLMTRDEAVDRIKLESRRYAKRQLTWFRRDKRINWIDITDISMKDAARKICDCTGRT